MKVAGFKTVHECFTRDFHTDKGIIRFGDDIRYLPDTGFWIVDWFHFGSLEKFYADAYTNPDNCPFCYDKLIHETCYDYEEEEEIK